jgi:hypothetical protein
MALKAFPCLALKAFPPQRCFCQLSLHAVDDGPVRRSEALRDGDVDSHADWSTLRMLSSIRRIFPAATVGAVTVSQRTMHVCFAFELGVVWRQREHPAGTRMRQRVPQDERLLRRARLVRPVVALHAEAWATVPALRELEVAAAKDMVDLNQFHTKWPYGRR